MIDSIETDLKTALRSGDKDKVLVLKGVKSSLINERIKLGHDLDEEEAAKVLKSEAKQRQEAADIYRSGGAQDKADKELAEKTIIEVYLPQMMSEEEVSKIVDEVIAEVGKDSSKTGIIIGQVMARAKGIADGRQVAEAVKSKLQ